MNSFLTKNFILCLYGYNITLKDKMYQDLYTKLQTKSLFYSIIYVEKWRKMKGIGIGKVTKQPKAYDKPNKKEKQNEKLKELKINVKNTPEPIETLKFSDKTYNCLKNARINNVKNLTDMSLEELSKIKGLDEESLKEIMKKLYNKF